jgi:hypothetical protein
MTLSLGAQLAYLNQLKNTLKLKMARFQKMKNSLLILTYFKSSNICGVFRCRSKSLDTNLNGRLPHFLLQVFLWFVRCVGAQTLKGKTFQ